MLSSRMKRVVFPERVQPEEFGELRPEGRCRLLRGERRVPQEVAGHQPDQHHQAAQRVEKHEVADGINQCAGQAHGDDLDQKGAQVEHALHPAADVAGGDVGRPGVEGGVVGGRAEEGHQRVGDHDRRDGEGGSPNAGHGGEQDRG